MANVEVYIWKVYYNGNQEAKRELAPIYGENNEDELTYPLYTDANGKWYVPNIEVPTAAGTEYTSVKYDVEFKYDGQTYEPTTFLVTSKGDTSAFISGDTGMRNSFANDSMAKDDATLRDNFNKTFEEIYGGTPIEVDGKTQGKATGDQKGEYTLNYTSTDYQYNGTNTSTKSRKYSTLSTTTENGYIIEQYKMSATTGNGGLVFPFDDNIHIEDYTKTISSVEDGVIDYRAIEEYMLNINLGLVEREYTDLAVSKDLYSAKVVVNNKLLTYNYNTAINYEVAPFDEYLNCQLQVAEKEIEYELNLYKSDYSYRVAMYDIIKDSDPLTYSKISRVKTLDTEMDVFLTYKVSVYNESETLAVKLKEIADYYDADLTLVSVDVDRNIQDAEGNYNTVRIADETYYDVMNSNEDGTYPQDPTPYSSEGSSKGVSWVTKDGVITSTSQTVSGESLQTNYKKMTTDSFKDYTLNSGDRIDLYITFSVNKTNHSIINNGLELGSMNNMAEVTRFSSYYADGRVAGRVDKDSAPDNANLESFCKKEWFEDDTDAAPIIKIDLKEDEREINGVVWEDERTNELQYSQKVGDGRYDKDNEKAINGITVKLVEKITVPDEADSSKAYDYDFIWPEQFMYDGDLISLSDFTSLKPVTTTQKLKVGNDTESSEELDGMYRFTGVPAGNYSVKFVYGDTINAKTENGEAGTPEDEPVIYNGQDYKSARYQAGYEKLDNEGYLSNEWHNLENSDLKADRVSDAYDDELRRMEVVAYSRTITNPTAEVLETADSLEANHTELLENTYMEANTAKLNLQIEHNDNTEVALLGGIEAYTIDGYTNVNKVKANTTEYHYEISNLDFGLEKRPENSIEISKMISKISVLTSDNTTLVSIEYDDEGNVIGTTIGSENIQSVANSQSLLGGRWTQGYKWINIDEEVMQGTTIKIDYKIIAKNAGEVDRTGKLAELNSNEDIMKELRNIAKIYLTTGDLTGITLSEEEKNTVMDIINSYHLAADTPIGKYLGRTYYTADASDKYKDDKIVTTMVNQVLDYVDNDAVFDQTSSENRGFRTITVNELKDAKLLAKSSYKTYTKDDGTEVDTLMDPDEVLYDTESKSNIVINVEDNTVASTLLVNTIPEIAWSEDNSLGTSTSNISLQISRYISSDTDTNDLKFDNLTEMVKFSNSVGRRDELAKVGNVNPLEASNFVQGLENYEHDSANTEYITFTKPTGTDNTLFIVLATFGALVLIGGSIVFIKRKIIK